LITRDNTCNRRRAKNERLKNSSKYSFAAKFTTSSLRRLWILAACLRGVDC